MGIEISRNAMCTCGSGKKYKHCCLVNPKAAKTTNYRWLLLLVVSIVAGVGAWQYKDWETGLAAGIGTLVVASIIASAINPPPSKGSGNPGAINFGG